MKSLTLAFLAVALQVAAAAESGSFTCAKDRSELTITGADSAITKMHVKGKAGTSACEADVTGGDGTLAFSYGDCGLTVPSGGGNVDIVIYTTVLSNGANSGSPDSQHSYTCVYNSAEEPVLTGTSSSTVTSTEAVTAVSPVQVTPTLRLEIVDSSSNAIYTAENPAAAGTQVLFRVTVSDDNGLYDGLAIITKATYKSDNGLSIKVIDGRCTTGLERSTANVAQQRGSPIPSGDIVVDSTDVNMVMFSPPASATLTVEVEVAICVTTDDVTCKPTNCTPLRRRRDAHRTKVIFAYANSTLSVKDENEDIKTGSQPICTGYTSNTVFYVVVVVLAVLLVLTIGVAAYFGAQAKKQVVLTGKDNPVYTATA